jgi:hypothetical protein
MRIWKWKERSLKSGKICGERETKGLICVVQR